MGSLSSGKDTREDWLGEIGNSLWLHFSGYAPLWGEPGPTAYLILVGINVETTLMFLLFGLAFWWHRPGKLLPATASERQQQHNAARSGRRTGHA